MRICNSGKGWRIGLIGPVLFLGLAIVFILCFYFGGIGASAQSGRKPQNKQGPGGQSGQQGQDPAEKPVLRIETREVVIPLSAYDIDGKAVDDLTTKDGLGLEDDEHRSVTSVKHEPANIVLVLDLCNEIGTFKNGPSTYRRLPEEEAKPDKETPVWAKPYDIIARPTPREFADNFISRLSSRDQVAIIQYSDKVQLVQDWTSDRQQALSALSAKYRIGLKSHYYDALALAAQKLQERTTGRRLIVLVSDGIDGDSRITQPQALTAIKQAQATVFVIGWTQALRDEIRYALGEMENQAKPGIEIVGYSRKRKAALANYLLALDVAAIGLRSMAEMTGGDILLPPTHRDLASSPPTLLSEIGAQYSLAFLTELKPSLDNMRSIVVLPARRGLSVRSRSSYYINESRESRRTGFND